MRTISQRIHLDANVILRFLRNDNPKQTPLATNLFKKADAGEVALFVSSVTINEVFFVLTSFCKLSHQQSAKILLPFVRTGVAEFENADCLVDALRRVIDENVDFGDAFLAAEATQCGDLVASFDKDFLKFKDVPLYDLAGKA
jgi:predicted nucleic-acid-binding protein